MNKLQWNGSWAGWPQPRHAEPSSIQWYLRLWCYLGFHAPRYDLQPVLTIYDRCLRCGRRGLV